MTPCFVIGIAGGSASGKEALLRELSACSIQLLAMDAYFKPEEELPFVTVENGRQYRDYNCPDSFNLERLQEDIQSILHQRTVDVLLVEGLLTLWDEDIRSLCDLRVFVDCPADIRILRRIRRNLTWGLSFDDIADVYLDLVRYRHEEYVAPSAAKADIVICSEHGIDDGVQELCDRIRRKLI